MQKLEKKSKQNLSTNNIGREIIRRSRVCMPSKHFIPK